MSWRNAIVVTVALIPLAACELRPGDPAALDCGPGASGPVAVAVDGTTGPRLRADEALADAAELAGLPAEGWDIVRREDGRVTFRYGTGAEIAVALQAGTTGYGADRWVATAAARCPA